MGEFGWAYISGSAIGQGLESSVQFLKAVDGELTGSGNFTYLDSIDTLMLTGSLIISGTLQAHQFDVIQTNTIEIYLDGSTNFGNTSTDEHVLTGSLIMTSGAIRRHYEKTTASSYSISAHDSIVGITSSAYVSVLLPSASVAGVGRTIIIKDEEQTTRSISAGTHIAVSASGTEKIDHASTYSIEGDSVALSLYSNGSNWFIY